METDEVIVQKLGDAVISVPKDRMWDTFLEGLSEFTDDFFADGRTRTTGINKKIEQEYIPAQFFCIYMRCFRIRLKDFERFFGDPVYSEGQRSFVRLTC